MNRGGSLLVSAAAGSGKTKVLVERLFSYMLDPEHPADVTDFLIITYTKAAAAELRTKIAAELSERLAEHPDDLHLQKQSLLVYRADVRTVDSFCTNLLREHVQLIGKDEAGFALTPDFRVMDEQEAALLRLQALETALEQFYETVEEDAGAALLADTIGAGRDDIALQELVLQLFGKLQSHAYPMKWMEKQKAYWEEIPEKIEDSPYGQELLEDSRRTLRYWEKKFTALCRELECDEALQEKYLPCFETAKDSIAAYLKALDHGWDAAAAKSFEFQRLKPVRGENALKDRAKALWDQCKKDCEKIKTRFSVSNDAMREDLQHMAPAMLALLRLTASFGEEYAREKLRRNVTDFSDQEHFALELLVDENGNATKIGQSVSKRYREIMIDEFQDTNEVQNQIFAAVSQEQKNLFMVGDMKQSIYRFRLADPTIFLRHYEQDPMYDVAKEGEERKLILSKNFRSRQEILDGANFICSNIMSADIGEMAYTDQEALHFGAAYYQEKKGCESEFYLMNYKKAGTADGKDEVKCAEAEARFVAERIRKLLDEPYMVQGEDGDLRPIVPEDIVILMRSPNSRKRMYERVLAEQGIACAAEANSEFFETMEIAVAVAMLEIIDNPHQDVPLISVLRSPVFGFTPDRLAQIRAGSMGGDFFTALQKDESDDTKAFLAALEELRFIAPDMSVHRLIWHLYNVWNVLGVFGAMDDGDVRREHLIALYEHAKNFETAGYKGIFRFISHLRALLESGEGLEAASVSAGQGVRMMSIHKSKGLEFPVVILADLNKKFNMQDLQASVLVHPEMGLGPNCIDLNRKIRYTTVAKDAVSLRQMREQKSEEMRVLYVALTRAKEKMILVASMHNAAGTLKKLIPRVSCPAAPELVSSCDSMAKWVLLPLLCRVEAEPLRAAADMECAASDQTGSPWKISYVDSDAYQTRKHRSVVFSDLPAESVEFSAELLDYQYPYTIETALPSKLTATQLKGRMIDQRISEDTEQPAPRKKQFNAPRFMQGERKLTPAERGIAMHAFMQFLDFSKTSSAAELQEELCRVTEKHLLTREQADSIDLSKILTLFASPLGRELRETPADRLWREYRFSVLDPVSNYEKEAVSGDQVLLQGAVDCFFETEEGLVVIDFKTDYIMPRHEAEKAEEYRIQLETYSHVLEKIFDKPICRKVLYFFSTGSVFSF